MKTTGIFATTVYDIPVKTFKDTYYIVPFSDMHWGDRCFAHDKWKEFKKWAIDTPTAHFLGNGDYQDFTNARDRAGVLRLVNESSRARLDEVSADMVEEMAGELEFMRGRLIGLGEGNHYWEFDDGSTSTQRLAMALRCPYLGVSAVARVVFNHSGSEVALQIYQHHGKGSSATTTGGHFLAVERLAKHVEGVQVFVMGHDHYRGGIPGQPKLRFVANSKKPGQLLEKEYPVWYVRCGSFLRSYQQETPSYVVDGAMGPGGLGVVKLTARPHRTKADGLHVDIGCIN